MHVYGLSDSLWSVIAAQVTFATPYAILILHQYGKLIPLELDESAKVDGATPFQVYWRIYLPLMAPALAAVGVYALLLAWNEYLYQYLLIVLAAHIPRWPWRSTSSSTSDEAPWNYMMAVALVYSLPPSRDLFRTAPLHGGGTDRGGPEGLTLVIRGAADAIYGPLTPFRRAHSVRRVSAGRNKPWPRTTEAGVCVRGAGSTNPPIPQ